LWIAPASLALVLFALLEPQLDLRWRGKSEA
jgi:hypothetical protein